MRRLILLSTAVCALLAAAPASAQLNDFEDDGSVPPAAVGGSNGGFAEGSGGAGATASDVTVATPPAPKPEPRKRSPDASSPAVTARPAGPDVPTWALILLAAALPVGTGAAALYAFGVDFSRFTRPLGAAAGEARARTFDRALELWETVRFGR